jgi:hypothetical protein
LWGPVMPKGEYRLKHGMSDTRLYKIFRGMVDRTTNPKHIGYSQYGGRGITVCSEWLNEDNGFLNFYNWAINNGYAEDLTIDRKEVNGDYEPSNCQWVTMKEQNNNKTDNHFITYKGETRTLAEWSEALGGSRALVGERLKLGWSEERAVTEPVSPPSKCNTREICYNGKTQSLKNWAAELNINYKTLAGRLRKGWEVERAFSTLPDKKFATAGRKEEPHEEH